MGSFAGELPPRCRYWLRPAEWLAVALSSLLASRWQQTQCACLSRQPLHVLLHHDQCQHPRLPIAWLQPSYRIVVQPQGPCEWPINRCKTADCCRQSNKAWRPLPKLLQDTGGRLWASPDTSGSSDSAQSAVGHICCSLESLQENLGFNFLVHPVIAATSRGEGRQGSSLDQLLQHTSLSLSLGLEPVQLCFLHRCSLAMHCCHRR